MTDFNVWVYGLDLPEIPHKARDEIKSFFAQGIEMTKANAAVFPAFRNSGVLLSPRHFMLSGQSGSAVWTTRP